MNRLGVLGSAVTGLTAVSAVFVFGQIDPAEPCVVSVSIVDNNVGTSVPSLSTAPRSTSQPKERPTVWHLGDGLTIILIPPSTTRAPGPSESPTPTSPTAATSTTVVCPSEGPQAAPP